MGLRLIRLSLRRRIRRSEELAKDLSEQTEDSIERYVFKRLGRIVKVRRFVAGWIILMLIAILATIAQIFLLSGYYQTLQPVPGGIYNEGIIGTFTSANPIYAVSDVDTTVSHLLFASLFTYNADNQLSGELASSYSVNSLGNVYTVYLKPHLLWQDNQPITSSDVVFTYNLIENPDAQSPLFNSWQDIKVSADGPLTVVFTLPDPLASFPEDLTGGILPEHILSSVPADEMRSATFNSQDPVGSGPFSWQTLSVSGNDPTNAEEQIVMTPFNQYVLGKPKLQEFVIHAYANQSELIGAFTSGQLNGAEGLDEVPSSIASMSSTHINNMILTAGVYAFFKTSSGVLANQAVRTALTEGVNVPAIINSLGYPTHEVNEPLLEGQLGYNPAYKEPEYNLVQAEATLNQAGWVVGSGGLRTSNGQSLSFDLTIPNSPEYLKVGRELTVYWHKLGANVQLNIEDQSDFNISLEDHSYQAILYGISIGVDPDVFVYWDSSQALANSPSRLNLSEWSNSSADESLEEGRTRLDPALRIIKYQGLLQAWQQDLPALGLYQPRLLYITNGPVFGLNSNTININTDRLNNVQNWEIDEAKVTE